jgi:hypothetical protein
MLTFIIYTNSEVTQKYKKTIKMGKEFEKIHKSNPKFQ